MSDLEDQFWAKILQERLEFVKILEERDKEVTRILYEEQWESRAVAQRIFKKWRKKNKVDKFNKRLARKIKLYMFLNKWRRKFKWIPKVKVDVSTHYTEFPALPKGWYIFQGHNPQLMFDPEQFLPKHLQELSWVDYKDSLINHTPNNRGLWFIEIWDEEIRPILEAHRNYKSS